MITLGLTKKKTTAMDNSVRINKIVMLFQELDEVAKNKLMHQLKKLHANNTALEENSKKEPEQHFISDLAGVGAEIWEGIDPDEYVRKLREEWD